MTQRCAERATMLYKNFVDAECVQTTVRTAEMCKLTENSFRDVNIAFANELSIICEKLDINIWELINLANRHPRVNILKPGPGVGGHCIAVDPWFIVSKSPDEARLIKTARQVNDSKPVWVLAQVEAAVAEFVRKHRGFTVSDVTIACFGLAFKPDIDDLRESPAVSIVAELAKAHAGKVLAVEPNIAALPPQMASRVELVDIEAALAAANIALILVDHKAFRHLTRTSFQGMPVINVCREDF
jgi:UDP-N-acetyl-D-mannosaminuronic acid dehydrogenase